MRRLGWIAAWLLMTAARQEAAPLPDMLLPVDPANPLGKPFTAKPGDEVLRGRVVKSMTVKMVAPVSVSLARFSHDFQPGEALTPVLLKPEKQGEMKMIFCGPDQRSRSEFGAAMIGDWFSKFEAVVRFCFEDEDNDGKFEGFILGGAKDPAFQGVQKIAPVAYEQKDMAPYDADSSLSIVYRKFDPDSRKITFELKLMLDGKPQRFDFITSTALGKVQRDYAQFRTDPAKVPYPSHFDNIVGANIGVYSLDPATGQAQIAINRNFPATMIKPITIQHQTIYIYIYR